MTNSFANIIPILVAAVGIGAAVAPFLTTTFYNQLYNKPDINFNSRTEDGKILIRVTNNGSVPATNFSLLIKSDANVIKNVTNEFSTVNIQLPKYNYTLLSVKDTKVVNGSFLQVFVPKFINGIGSRIILALSGNSIDRSDYSAYSTYDQGSSTYPEAPPLPAFENPTSIIFPLIIETIVVLFFTAYGKKIIRKRYISKIINDIVEVCTTLKDDIRSEQIFSNTWYQSQRPNLWLRTYFFIQD